MFPGIASKWDVGNAPDHTVVSVLCLCSPTHSQSVSAISVRESGLGAAKSVFNEDDVQDMKRHSGVRPIG